MATRAIVTSYGGRYFRSRLEARWAVFFDAAGVAWEYEPEGFELPSGLCLPDFRIHPGGDLGPVWFETRSWTRPAAGERPDPCWPELVRETGRVLLVARGMHQPGDECGRFHSAKAYGPDGGTEDMSRAWTGEQYQGAWDAALSAKFGARGAAA